MTEEQEFISKETLLRKQVKVLFVENFLGDF